MSPALAPPKLPSFDEPLRMLHAGHIRIEQRCALLAELYNHVNAHGCDERARRTADVILRYFDDACAKHHEDEQQDLYPVLLESLPGEERDFVVRLIDHLRTQHRELERVYAALRPALDAIVAGRKAELSHGLCERLYQLYLEHIEIEETEILPVALERLTVDAMRRLGSAMAARRNIPFTPAAA